MPDYRYQCQKCEHEFEVFEKQTAKRKKKCPECNKMALETLLFPVRGRIAKTENDMKTLGELGKMRRDRMSKTEREQKDAEIVENSKLAKNRLGLKKGGYDRKTRNKLSKLKTPEQVGKYIWKGETPSE